MCEPSRRRWRVAKQRHIADELEEAGSELEAEAAAEEIGSMVASIPTIKRSVLDKMRGKDRDHALDVVERGELRIIEDQLENPTESLDEGPVSTSQDSLLQDQMSFLMSRVGFLQSLIEEVESVASDFIDTQKRVAKAPRKPAPLDLLWLFWRIQQLSEISTTLKECVDTTLQLISHIYETQE
jgi:hypothetical protein